MDIDQARALLSTERTRVEGLLRFTKRAGEDDRNEANVGGDMSFASQMGPVDRWFCQ